MASKSESVAEAIESGLQLIKGKVALPKGSISAVNESVSPVRVTSEAEESRSLAEFVFVVFSGKRLREEVLFC